MFYFIRSAFLSLLLLQPAFGQLGGMTERSSILPNSKCQITIQSAFESLPSWGYYPTTITLRNNSVQDQSFRVEAVSSSYPEYYYHNDYGIEATSSFALSCPAGQEKTYDLLLPVVRAGFGEYGHSNDTFKNNSLALTVFVGSDVFSASIVGSFKQFAKVMVFSHGVSKFQSGSYGNAIEDRQFDVSRLKAEHKAFQGYDSIFLLKSEWEQLSEAVQQTFREWVRTGGQLVILLDPSKNINSRAHQAEKLKLENQLSRVFEIRSVDDAKSPWKETGQHSKSLQYHNGRVNYCGQQGFDRIYTNTESQKVNFASLNQAFSTGLWPLQNLFEEKSFGEWPLTFLLLIFAIMVGPINFFVIAKQGRRHRLVFTTPVISLGMSAILILYIMFQDGIGGEGSRILLKEVNQDTNKAYVQQEQFSRTGVLIGTGFDLDNDFLINQVPISDSRWARVSHAKRAKESYNITRGDSTTSYSGGYFASRSEHGHLITGDQVTQEGISIAAKGNSLEIISTFEDSLDELYLKTNGKFFLAKGLKTGSPVIAEEVSKAQWIGWMDEQESKLSSQLGNVLERNSQRPNSYVAFSANSKGIETLSSIDWTTSTLTTGTFNANEIE